MTIYLISELWQNSMENQGQNALGYEIVGFVPTKDEAEALVAKHGEIYPDCWAAFGEKMPILKWEAVELLDSTFQLKPHPERDPKVRPRDPKVADQK